MAYAHKNFAYSTIAGTDEGNTSNPGSGGTSIRVQRGDGARFPLPPFNATVWPVNAQPTTTNAEIIQVTDIQDDVFTVTRTQEGTSARTMVVGDQIAATITAQTLTDAEAPLTYWANIHIAGTNQTGVQTLGASGLVGTNSLLVFPVTAPPNLQFNQVLIGNSLSFVTNTSNTVGSNTYYSYYGLYSLNANTALNLISSSSFSIQESINSRSVTWSFPQTTATSGWGYQTSSWSTSGPISSYVSGSRIIGIQFGGNVTLTGGQYYLGILSLRSTANTVSTCGLSQVGLVGQPVVSLNKVAGSVVPLGIAASAWSGNNANQTQWWGRHILGLVTRTALYGGNAIPSTVAITELGTTGGAGSTVTILPAVTFVST